MKSIFLLASVILPFCIHSDEEIQFPLPPLEEFDFPHNDQPYARITFSNQTFNDIIVGTHNIYVASDFDEITYVTAYSLSGEPVWEVPFNSEIHSWKIKDGLLFVFSMARDDHAYYLTCIDANAGTLLWERAILAPVSS